MLCPGTHHVQWRPSKTEGVMSHKHLQLFRHRSAVPVAACSCCVITVFSSFCPPYVTGALNGAVPVAACSCCGQDAFLIFKFTVFNRGSIWCSACSSTLLLWCGGSFLRSLQHAL